MATQKVSIHVGMWSGQVIKPKNDYCVWLHIGKDHFTLEHILTRAEALKRAKPIAVALGCKLFDCDNDCKLKAKKAKKRGK